MSTCQIIDTFPTFTSYWDKIRGESRDTQIDAWAAEYMSLWPELLARQIEDYSSQNPQWRQIARQRVFPYLAERLPTMRQAHQNLLELCESIYSRAQQVLAFESNAIVVIYVGIGCGAGWATTFRGLPAILFGLENIAESGWSDREAIMGLVAHEIGHLVHHQWRAQHGKRIGSGPWWQLYEEGFARHSESLILDSGRWHQAGGEGDDDWLEWCQGHKGRLAAEFVRTVNDGKPVSPFFGSWCEIYGKRHTGYFLGYTALKELEKCFDVKQLALLEDVELWLRPVLEQLMDGG